MPAGVFGVINVADRFRVLLTVTVLLKTLPASANFTSNGNDRVNLILHSLSIKQSLDGI